MALNLTGALGDVGNLLGGVSLQDIAAGALTTGAVTVAINGLKDPNTQNQLDPLHIFSHPAQPATAAAPATPATAGIVSGNVITMSQWMSLTADQQKMLATLKYTIIPG